MRWPFGEALMSRSLEPFDFAEDDEDAATVLMSGHQRHLLREVLRTPAPLEAHLLEPQDSPEPAPEVADFEDEETPRWGMTIAAFVVACAAIGAAIWRYIQLTS
jgi:hypothetical protein